MQRYIKTGIFSFIFVVRLSAADPAPQDADAQFNLGMAYANGQGVPKNESEAVNWFRKAAEQGNADAQFNLGGVYLYGQGVPVDEAEAVNWYRKAAEQGNAGAQFNLGRMYFIGQGVSKDEAEAVNWLRKAAEQGNTYAHSWLVRESDNNVKIQNILGMLYYEGKGVPKDEAKAVYWFREAARYNADAQFNLGVMYTNGQGVPKDEAEAVNWFRKAAEQGNERALNSLHKAADQGNADAQLNLGVMYANGQGVPKDEAKAVNWFRKAAEQQGNAYALNWLLNDELCVNNATVQNILGMMYYEGKGVPKDEHEAIEWFRKAASQGNEEAINWMRKIAEQGNVTEQYNLGKMYYRGSKNVPKDEAEAAKWFRKAAEQGNAYAQHSLGEMYYNGNGVPKDKVVAVHWFRKIVEKYNLVITLYNTSDAVESLRKVAKQDYDSKDYDIAFWCKSDLGVAKEQVPSDIVIKKMFIGMSIDDACKIANDMDPPHMVIKTKQGYTLDAITAHVRGLLFDIASHKGILFVHADQDGQVDAVVFSASLTNALFNVADMQPDTFAQEIINNYNIPSLEPFVGKNIFSTSSDGWEFSSPQGTRIRVYSDKAIELQRITKSTERKFD